MIRKFAGDSDIENLYAFVECYDTIVSGVDVSGAAKPVDYEHKYPFRLVSPMPRAVYKIDTSGSVGKMIGRSGNLIVEPIEDEEDEGN